MFIIVMSKEFQIRSGKGSLPRKDKLRGSSLNPKEVDHNGTHAMQVYSDDDIEKKFWSRHLFEKVLGKGGYGLVVLIREKTSGHQSACKIVDKEKVSSEIYSSLRAEPKFLTKLSTCKYVVNLVETVESRKRLFVVMEYMKGGDLSHYIHKKVQEGSPFRESEVCVVVAGVLRALKAIHGNNIIHGDIKPGTL
jgi:serine/threonine protein kinase